MSSHPRYVFATLGRTAGAAAAAKRSGHVDGDLVLAARTGVPVLITDGDPERRLGFAADIHDAGAQRAGMFVHWLPAGAAHDAAGLRQAFEQARGGTLFVDDLYALTPGAWAQLLLLLSPPLLGRVSHRDSRNDVRLICGASRGLHDAIRAGVLSERLFYRLNVIHVNLLAAPGRS